MANTLARPAKSSVLAWLLAQQLRHRSDSPYHVEGVTCKRTLTGHDKKERQIMMEYRTLGSSGVSVSTLALGTMTFGTETDEEASHAQLDQFIEAGGNLVDTADVYSHGASEQIIGRWLAKRPPEIREQVVLATKGRFATGAGPNEVGLSRRHLARALDASLGRLGVDTIDLYQVHAWDPLHPDRRDPGVPRRRGARRQDPLRRPVQLHRLADPESRRRGRRPRLGTPRHAAAAVQPARPGSGVGDRARLRGRRARPAAVVPAGRRMAHREVPTADERPTGATRLGENPNRGVEAYDRRGAHERTWDVLGAVEEIARSRGLSMAQVALAWLVDRPTVCSVILGARTQEQLDDNLGAAGVHLSDDEIRRLDQASDPSPADYPYGGPGVEQRSRRIAGD